MSRLIWIHVPLRVTFDGDRSREAMIEEAKQVMKEKKLALDLIEGCAHISGHERGLADLSQDLQWPPSTI